jgi:beta-ureidopropionase / N-carbamoyl-L-amino-acid hydrolase
LQQAFETAAVAHNYSHTRMPSGAGHDAQVLSSIMPAAMLFVPSIGGISHHWTENTSDEDIICGAKIFVTAAVSRLRSAASKAPA